MLKKLSISVVAVLALSIGTQAQAQKKSAKNKTETPLVEELQPPLEPLLMAIADQIHTGKIVCEAGAMIQITEKINAPGRFVLKLKNENFNLMPVASLIGAIRLEDAQQGAVWIQLANKSMLMSSKLGRRLADECQSPAQSTVAQAMKLAPPINILEPQKDVAQK